MLGTVCDEQTVPQQTHNRVLLLPPQQIVMGGGQHKLASVCSCHKDWAKTRQIHLKNIPAIRMERLQGRKNRLRAQGFQRTQASLWGGNWGSWHWIIKRFWQA
ncbi:MAG TPA: hypothetical protein PK299_10215 [Anaerolineales bacterium]|nr:hypothetical protein [Anaerolineales bacterium]